MKVPDQQHLNQLKIDRYQYYISHKNKKTQKKNMNLPDKSRTFVKGKIDLVKIDDTLSGQNVRRTRMDWSKEYKDLLLKLKVIKYLIYNMC